ncbi:MAG: hypothetical protein NT031_20910, partial [Planctomycetota bacterium]|nr:hypothetical protein [Planctomycetota bacterium]
AKIAAHVAARVAQPQAPEAAAGLGGLVQAVAGDWTALQRSQCVTALRVEVGPKAASLEDLRAIEPVCRPLGEEVFGTVVGDWVNAQADWQRFSPADLNAMVDLLKPSQTARGTRVKVAAQLTALALNDATAFHGLSPASICLRARGIAPDLAPALRERWIAALRGLFGKAAINRTELADVRETLHALGDAQSEQFLADWVAAQGSWTAWSGQDIVGLLGQLKGTGEAARAARSKLAAQLSATVVAPEALASMPLETLGQVVAPAAAGWTAAQRAAFLASAGPALMVRANSIETLRAVEPICRALGDDAFGGFLARWVDGQQAWRQFSLADMNALYGLMKGAGCRQPARASVVARIIATILGDAQSLDPAAAGALSQSARALATDMLPAVREQWVGSIHTAFAKAPLSLA